MKVRAQIGMVLNLDKCIGCAVGNPPSPTLPPGANHYPHFLSILI